MKITNPAATNRKHRQTGMAAIIMLALLGLVLAFIFANLNSLSELRGELKAIEQKQIRRLNHSNTNGAQVLSAVSYANSPDQQAANPRAQ
jgi:hypothetical protein